MRLRTIIFLFLVLPLIGCVDTKKEKQKARIDETNTSDNQESEEFKLGTVNDNVYTNEFFGFRMELPAEWHVMSRKQLNQISKMGQEVLAGDDKNFKRMLKASEVTSANLLGLSKKELGAAAGYNPTFILLAENVRQKPGIKNGGVYLENVQQLLHRSKMTYNFTEERPDTTRVNGETFYVMNAELEYLDNIIRQRYYAALRNGFSFCFIITYVDEPDKETLLKMINSMTFEQKG